MPSAAPTWWQSKAPIAFREVEAAHAAIGGTGPGRRFATGQVNNAYVVLLSSQFQRFCRDLHAESADYLSGLVPPLLRAMVYGRLTEGRKLDVGNPNRGNLGSDFNRFGFEFWNQPEWSRAADSRRRAVLD